MTENEFILSDRLQKIRQIINQYGEENFYISFSGGKDSTVLSKLVDMTIPSNDIPRVYADTGIELNMIRDFVYSMAEWDWRIKIIKPSVNVKDTLEFYGYPFKSKRHAKYVDIFQRNGVTDSTRQYLTRRGEYYKGKLQSLGAFNCPDKLRYQFEGNFKLNVSDKCCYYMKEKPLTDWSKQNEKKYFISGIMPEEGGRRIMAKCLTFLGHKLKSFSPLVPVTKKWEDWFIEEYNIEICDIYKEPYNFPRTGCKGCPFIINLQEELDVLQKYFPAERKQCEIIWKPVYDEYRRIGYRLKDKYDIEKGMPL